MLSANYHYDMNDERVTDVRERYEKQYKQPMETAAVLTYQAVEVIEAALEEACSTDPTAIRDAIAELQVEDSLLAFEGRSPSMRPARTRTPR